MAQIVVNQLDISGPAGAQTFDIPHGRSIIGRQAGVDIVLDEQLISRRHAQIECDEAGCTITDLKSSNGTVVNKTRLRPGDPVPLNPGDVIEVGSFVLTYDQVTVEVPSEPEPLPPEPLAKPEPPAGPEPGPEPEPAPEPKVKAKAKTTEPPPPAPPPSPPEPNGRPDPAYTPPPGLSLDDSRYLQYLPDIYHTPFMKRFLALFESIYAPIEWTADNFDLYLHPQTAPADFLPWLANWFDITFDKSWSEEQQRTLLTEAHQIYARRGTKWALSRVLEIYTGHTPQIDDSSDDLDPFTFTVTLPIAKSKTNPTLVARLINAHKPAHTAYRLNFKK
jgi:phage tail-like protein